MTLCIITARGGSKRIPRKNIRLFHGRPMIAWPIAAALASGLFSTVLVSTEDAAIAETARQAGASTPFLRPAALADDYTHAHVAARHALTLARDMLGDQDTYFCHLYPCTPFLDAALLRRGYEAMRQGRFDNLLTVTRLGFPVYQMLRRTPEGALDPFFEPSLANARSQDMPTAVFDLGWMYWYRTEHFLTHDPAVTDRTGSIEVPSAFAVDIDEEEDWDRAETLFAAFHDAGQALTKD